jgi:hypothetical protein
MRRHGVARGAGGACRIVAFVPAAGGSILEGRGRDGQDF